MAEATLSGILQKLFENLRSQIVTLEKDFGFLRVESLGEGVVSNAVRARGRLPPSKSSSSP